VAQTFFCHFCLLINPVSDMNQYSQQLESMPHLDQHHDETPWRQSYKVKVFAFGCATVLALGLLWTLFQPSVYRSEATVLMSAPDSIDAMASEANIQKVAIQRTILLGEEITEQLEIKLEESGLAGITSTYLRNALSVDPLPETNLITMSAQSADSELLPTVVDTWVDVYTAARALDINERKNQTVQQLNEELESLALKIEEARDALEQYRDNNNIVSAKREENDVLARLDGLNTALNNAIEDEVKTTAHLKAVRKSIEGGKKVIPSSDSRNIQFLERELDALRKEMTAITKRYTLEYINKQPALRAIPERIEKLETELDARLSEGQAIELASAAQAYSAALTTVQDLRLRLNEHKENVSRFNRVYATHEALVEDLSGLEQLSRQMQARLVQVEVQQVNKYPQVTVIERPRRSQHIGPNYAMLLGGTALAAVGFGLFCVWLYGFLGHEQKQPAYVTLSGVSIYPQDSGVGLAHMGPEDPRVERPDTRLLRGDQEHPDKTAPLE
jgi:succinoglycan biosynthesis transport protein ExoP